MKPFNLDLAKSGAPIVTRNGRPAKFIAHVPESENLATRVIVLVNQKDVKGYYEDGFWHSNHLESQLDLFHPSVKKSGWINIYEPLSSFSRNSTGVSIYPTKEDAEEASSNTPSFITTIEIHWEE